MRAGNFSHSAECANCRKLTDNFADAMDVQSFSYEYDVWAQFHQSTPWKAVGGGRYPFVWRKGVLNGYSSTRVSLWDSLMFGRLAMGFANVRASRYGIR